MCNKAVSFILLQYRLFLDAIKMCNNAVNTCFNVFYSVPDRYLTQEMCDKVVSEDFLMLTYCPNRYKIQKNV